jgi:hypothetical protein
MTTTTGGFSFPIITAFEDKNVKNKVNAAIMSEGDSLCTCDNSVSATGCQVNAEVTYTSDYIFSFSLY